MMLLQLGPRNMILYLACVLGVWRGSERTATLTDLPFVGQGRPYSRGPPGKVRLRRPEVGAGGAGAGAPGGALAGLLAIQSSGATPLVSGQT
jgi:hypothetical protein